MTRAGTVGGEIYLKKRWQASTSEMVAAELVWTLLSYYKVPKAEIIEKVSIIISTPNLHIVTIDDSRLIAWLAEASLHARANGSAPLRELIDSPSFFPFQIKPMHADSLVAASSRLDILRHGLDEDLVMLRK
jgi:hypothetical protein